MLYMCGLKNMDLLPVIGMIKLEDENMIFNLHLTFDLSQGH